MARYRISLDEAPDEEYEIEVDDATEPDFGKLTDEVRRMRASQRAQETAKKALDKAVQPVTTMKTPIREMYKDKTEGAIAEGLAGPLTGAAGGALVGGVPGALIGGLAGTLPGLMGGSTSTAEALMNLVPTPKMPKLPGVLGKLFNYGDRAKPAKEVLDALPNATPYASALKTRLANAVKGGVAGGLEAKARDAAVQALETGEVKNNGKATTAGAILGGLSGLANVTPIKATLRQQGTSAKKELEQQAQQIAVSQKSDQRAIEKLRESAKLAVTPKAIAQSTDPKDYASRLEMMTDEFLLNTPSRKGAKKTQAEAAAELRDRILKGEVDIEGLAGKVREITRTIDDADDQHIIGGVAGNLASHAYQMFGTGISRGLFSGLGAAIARGAKEDVNKINAALSRKMSSDKVRGLNKFIQTTVNQLNEATDKQIIKESLSAPEEEDAPPSSRQALLEAIARQEGYYNEKESRAKRNKNPGNIRSKEGPFYIYPSDDEGWAALSDLLDRNAREGYTDKTTKEKRQHTLSSYIAQHAPKEDNNDPAAYVKFVIEEMKKKGIDVNEDTLLEDILAQ